MANAFKAFSTSKVFYAIVRGCDFSVEQYSADAVMTMLGNEGIRTTDVLAEVEARAGRIFAYNKFMNTTHNSSPLTQYTLFDLNDFAFCQNVYEKTIAGEQMLKILSDGGIKESNNVLLFNNTIVGGSGVNFGYNSVGVVAKHHTNWFEKGNNFDNWNNKDDNFVGITTLTAIRNGTSNPGTELEFTIGSSISQGGVNETFTVVGTSAYDGDYLFKAGAGGLTITVAGTYTGDEDPGAATITNQSGNRVGGWPVRYRVNGVGNVYGKGVTDEWLGEFKGLNTKYGTVASPLAFEYEDNQSGSGSGGGNGDYHLTDASPGVGLMTEILFPYDIEGTARFIDSPTNGGAVGAYEFSGLVTVPDIVDSTILEADTAITDLGLIVGNVTEAFSDTIDLGNVISQNPAEAAEVDPGSAVDYVVSKGEDTGTGRSGGYRSRYS
jgi:hypothetical protein